MKVRANFLATNTHKIIWCFIRMKFLFQIIFVSFACFAGTIAQFDATANHASTEVQNILHSHINADKYTKLLSKHMNYLNRAPFPHAIVDDLFPVEALRLVANEIPDNPKLSKQGCVENSQNCHLAPDGGYFKSSFDDEKSFGPATMAVFGYLRSSQFIQFLEKLTGIKDIIPDPHYWGSGIHQTVRGGRLQIHADFNRYQRYELFRRVNVLLYLNENWNETWGGHLELWARDMQHCMVRTTPDIGKLAIFSSSDFSYHGHPQHLQTPPDRSRRSLALYYYTKHRPESDCVDGNCFSSHSTLYQKPPCKCEDKECQKFVEQG
jgi:hypothetical protein